MSTLKFKNGDLASIQEFLSGARLSGKASRGRSKLIKLITAKEKELQEDFDETRKPFILLDENGNPIIENQGVKFKDETARQKATNEMIILLDEEAVINVTEYEAKLVNLYDALADYPHELDGKQAAGYDVLLDQLEELKEGTHDVE